MPRGLAPMKRPAAALQSKAVQKLRRVQHGKEARADSRKEVRPQLNQRASLGSCTFLEVNSVTGPTSDLYHRRFTDFLLWAGRLSLPLITDSQIDIALVDFLNEKFFEGLSASEGAQFLSAWTALRPDFGILGARRIPRARRAMAGWRRLDPGFTRPPLPWMVVAFISQSLLEVNAAAFALCVMLMFFCYLRPSEALRLAAADLIAPASPGAPFALLMHPIEDGEVSKVGATDESMLIDPVDAPWLGEILWTASAAARKRGEPLFPFTYPELTSMFQQAVSRTGLQSLNPMLYQLRHGGPSHDRFFRRRSIEEVKVRGRWSSDKAMKRYEQHALLQREIQKLPPAVRQRAELSVNQLRAKLLSCMRRQPPWRSSRATTPSSSSLERRASLGLSPASVSTASPMTSSMAPWATSSTMLSSRGLLPA